MRESSGFSVSPTVSALMLYPASGKQVGDPHQDAEMIGDKHRQKMVAHIPAPFLNP